MDWYAPLFPELFPKLVDPFLFNTDKTTDDDSELTQLEHEHSTWLTGIQQKNCDIIPIGKNATEVNDEDDDEEEEDDNDDDDDTDTHDDEDDNDLDMDVNFTQ